MLSTITTFDTSLHHIHIDFFLTSPLGIKWGFAGILDTGASRTEFSDIFLVQTGFAKHNNCNVSVKPGLQTQKYGKILLPSIEICGQRIENFEVFVSRFDKSWGIAALIGLDFFRRYKVTIDYVRGTLETKPYPQSSK